MFHLRCNIPVIQRCIKGRSAKQKSVSLQRVFNRSFRSLEICLAIVLQEFSSILVYSLPKRRDKSVCARLFRNEHLALRLWGLLVWLGNREPDVGIKYRKFSVFFWARCKSWPGLVWNRRDCVTCGDWLLNICYWASTTC